MKQSTIISPLSSTKNKNGEWDPGMLSEVRGNQRFFEMRCHIGVDEASGLICSVVSTAANMHELNIAARRLLGKEEVVCAHSV